MRRTSSRGAAAARPAMPRRLGQQLVVGDAPPHQPDLLGFGRRRPPRRTAPWPRPPADRPPARSIHVWPPPGWMPSCRNRVSNRADAPARRTSQASARFMPAPDRGAVDGGQRRQRRPGDAQEALVDAEQALAASDGRRGGRGRRPAQNAGGAPVTTTAPTDVVGLELVERGDDLADHLGVERVAAVGIVEGHDGDAVGRPRRGPRAMPSAPVSRPRRGSGGRTARRRARSGRWAVVEPTSGAAAPPR